MVAGIVVILWIVALGTVAFFLIVGVVILPYLVVVYPEIILCLWKKTFSLA